MPLDVLTRSILEQMLQATRTILRRFAPIHTPEDFVASDEGLDRLDAICMQLIALGESTKNLDKVTDGALLPRYPDIEWRRLMGMRDVLSHHYFDLNEEVVFGVCAKQIPRLGQELERMLRDLDSAT
jgi:uncharacterized protein with HEPN domain